MPLSPPPAARANRVLVLLVFSVAINYIDRGALSVAAPLISQELSLTPAQLGLLFSAFFWSYASFQIVAGWLVDRYEVKWVYASGYLLWSLATAATGWMNRFGSLIGARVLLGIGESAAYPACSRILVQDFPEHRRGFANALVDAGSKIGPALSTLAGGLLVHQYGWRALFVGVGLGSLLWLIPWMLWVPRHQTIAAATETGRPAMLHMLRKREVWGTSWGMFSLGYVWYFLLSWLPTYLVSERGFSMRGMALVGSLPFWAMAGATLISGWASDRWIASGAPPTRVRKVFVTAGLLLCSITLLPAAVVDAPWVSVALLIASCASLGLFTSNVWAITQTLAGPQTAGKWTGIQNAIGNLGGVVSPVVTGLAVTYTGSFLPAFVAASLILIAGACSYWTLVGDIKPLAWERPAAQVEV